MGNMSYCRFENTFGDLADCQEALRIEGVRGCIEGASRYEKPYIKHLIELCREIVEEFGEDLEDIEDEDIEDEEE